LRAAAERNLFAEHDQCRWSGDNGIAGRCTDGRCVGGGFVLFGGIVVCDLLFGIDLRACGVGRWPINGGRR